MDNVYSCDGGYTDTILYLMECECRGISFCGFGWCS